MNRLLTVLTVFVALLLAVAALIFVHAHRAIVAQENAELGYFANELLDAMDEELAGLAGQVRNRGSQTYVPGGQGSRPGAAEPAYIIGWVSVGADGSFVTPSPQPARIGRRVAALRASADDSRMEAGYSKGDVVRESYQSPLAKRYLSRERLKNAFPKVDTDAIITNELEAAYQAGLAQGGQRSRASAVERAGGVALRAVILDSNTVFVATTVTAEGTRRDRGVLIAVEPLLRQLAERHFSDQPLAQYTRLELGARSARLASSAVTAGKGTGSGKALSIERAFAPPFDFLTCRLLAEAAPPSPGRATLRWLVIVFALVALSGAAVLARAVQAQNELALRRSLFVSSVTHELKTPLTAIGMYAEMLEQGMDIDAETRRRYFGVLKSETARLSRLIRNVLEFSQLEARRRRVAPGDGNLSATLREAERVMADQAAQAGFRLCVRAPEECPATFDHEAVVQILVNLVENSLKFGTRAERREIELFAEPTARGARFGVRDYGPGIAVKPINRIFDDFTRGYDAATRATKGTGIGLALVRRLAQAMGGRVEAENHEDSGCTVAVVVGRCMHVDAHGSA